MNGNFLFVHQKRGEVGEDDGWMGISIRKEQEREKQAKRREKS
jgi:hypothetical protein